MTEHTQINAEGEAIIPKEVCERLNWRPGMELEILATGERILVGPKPAPRERISVEEFRRRVPPHEGPSATLEEMNEAIDRAMAERWKAKEARSR